MSAEPGSLLKKKPRKKRVAQTAKNKADKYFSLIIRARGACQRCGKTTNLQCAHILSRRFGNTRCELTNALCLCAGCHRWGHDRPLAFASFVLEQIGVAECERLEKLAQQTCKVDWPAKAAELALLAKSLEAASNG